MAATRPCSSATAWILVVRPPLDRPIAWFCSPLFRLRPSGALAPRCCRLWRCGYRRASRQGAPRQHAREGSPLLCRGKRGAQNQAIGHSRGGRTIKLHALSDGLGRPIRFLLTGGQTPDCRSAEALLASLPPHPCYGGSRLRHRCDPSSEAQGAVPNIPPKATRRWKSCFSPVLYRARNAVERMFCSLKDYRRIATRYDKLGTNFLGAVDIVASVTCWL